MLACNAGAVSKAFTKEDDQPPEPPPGRRSTVPSDAPNYVTAAGVVALRAELEGLPPEDARAHDLTEHLATAVIVEPAVGETVSFGVTVVLEDGDGATARYTIVGVIEALPRSGRISWRSPIATTLLGTRIGDVVSLPRAGGAVEYTVVAIDV
jgi:transcription elongation GreA/GreB family factor